ncbi:MAG: gfo/Idh/MocA family oxidoreductase [Peptococcaceae bacterium]|jgi:UDP-2-acetamido-3-amino-2,3-dideoxy-glucuronate N-acetyltransferase|nr:MAG: gfo/Idh/MocA family oxidoreductase [Peptococcaceae bacterium]
MTEQNVAVIGGGYWGKNLIRNFAALGALHTICELDGQKIAALKAAYPDANAEGDFTAVLTNRQIKAVVIATPAALHYYMARLALLAGKDVFVEKPLALAVAEGKELVELARKQGKILMAGHILEYHPALLKLKELVKQEQLGKIQYIYSNRLNLGKFRTEENILWSFAPHDISAIMFLLEEVPLTVATHGNACLNKKIADVTVTNLSFAGGIKAHIFVSWLHPYKEQRLVITGSESQAVFDEMAENKLLLYNHKVNRLNQQLVPYRGKAEIIDFNCDEPLRLECAHFLDCISSRRAPRTGGKKALAVLRVLAACQRSLEKSGEVICLQ